MIAALMAAVVAGQALAYGAPISLVDAKRVMAAAQAEAAKRNTPATIAIVDPYGELVLAESAAGADGGALDVAMLQARASVDYRGKLVLNQQSTTGVSYTGVTPPAAAAGAATLGAGVLLISNGMIVGAIGDVGGAPDKVAQAGAVAAVTTTPPAPPRATPAAGMGMGAGMAAGAAMPSTPAPAASIGMAGGMGMAAGMATPATAAPAAVAYNYGPPITPSEARAVGVKAEEEKAKIGVDGSAIAVVDPAGRLVYFARQDTSMYGNHEMAVLKARAAARLRRPTSADNTRLKNGEQILLLVPSAFPADGGEPIVKNGQIIGAVGLAGGGRDGPVAQTAAQAVK